MVTGARPPQRTGRGPQRGPQSPPSQPSQHVHSPGAAERRAPQECPVCAQDLRVTALGCPNCGTGISGDFAQCEFCALDARDLDVLKVFLAARGNLRELERHLQVSYPTARARFDDVIRKLGLVAAPEPAEPARPATGPAAEAGPAAAAEAEGRLDTLRALAAGELDVEAARRLLESDRPA